jgi:thiol-disulfide isomerase/thioredoxin
MRRVLAALMVVGLLAGCAPGTDDGGPDLPNVGPVKVDVDTPALRAAKAKARIEDCAPGAGHNDLPTVTLPCFGGGPAVTLNRLKGPLVVAVWAQWCAPCRRELPFYQQLSQKYAGQLAVVGIDYTDVQTDWAMDLLTESGVTFPQVADPDGEIAGKRPFPRMNALPVVALVGADGTVTIQITAITSFGQLEDLVQHYLGVTA